MFPFSLKQDWNRNDIEKMLIENCWERKRFNYAEGDYASNFSEQGYFYDFTSSAMIDDPDSLNNVLATYQLPIFSGASYTININKEGVKHSYCLDLEKIELNVYDEKAAILSFHVANEKYNQFQDILYINDYGRRIYPQFLSNGENGFVDLQQTKNAFLADSIVLYLGDYRIYEENFEAYSTNRVPPFILPTYIKQLLPSKMQNCRWLLDDRMYLVSILCNNECANKWGNYSYALSDIEKETSRYSDWYQYVFVDNAGPTCVNSRMFAELLSNSTYTRWSNYGTLFGVTRYSFVSLTTDFGFNQLNILRQIKTMYYRMASLVLAQRALSLYYSREISEISKDLDEKKLTNKELCKRVNVLNRDYLRFVNNIYFREVTPQDQGIELYNMMQQQMNIQRDEEGLSTEVEQLYHYVTMVNDEQRSVMSEYLSIIATIFLIPTLLTGIWGMNLNEDNCLYWVYTVLTVLCVVFGLSCLMLKKKKR